MHARFSFGLVAVVAVFGCGPTVESDASAETDSGSSSGSTASASGEGGTTDATTQTSTTLASTSNGPSTTQTSTSTSGPDPDTGSDSSGTGPATPCAIRVELGGTDAVGCGGPGNPCATLTHAFAEWTEGCIELGPGTFDLSTGEVFPLELPEGAELRGSADETAPSIIDGSANASPDGFGVECQAFLESLRTTISTNGGRMSDLVIRGGVGTDYVTVLVRGGENELERLRVEGGQEGIFTTGNSNVTIVDAFVTGAGHAAIKPAGESIVEVRNTVMTNSKDALEPICEATTIVRDSEAYCNGNGLEALGSANTTMIDNDVHHNINGIAARGTNTQITATGNRVHDNAFGVVEVFGQLDLGSGESPGANDLSGNRFAAVMLNNVQSRTDAVGNTWTPNIDGADGAGTYSGTQAITGPVCGANNTEIEAPIPKDCDTRVPATRDPSYQNFALNDGSCSEPPSCGGAADPCVMLGVLVLSDD